MYSRLVRRFFLYPLLFLAAASAQAQDRLIPPDVEFRRTMDFEGFAHRAGSEGYGAQSFRARTRFLDPQVQAFVGLLAGFTHFNDALQTSVPPGGQRSEWLVDWGIYVGIQRGGHILEVDLLGVSFGGDVGFGPALVGEHPLALGFWLVHRTQPIFLPGDNLIDADSGLEFRWQGVGVRLGYRFFAGAHFSRNGPRAGLTWRFTSPKIPFLFPSLG